MSKALSLMVAAVTVAASASLGKFTYNSSDLSYLSNGIQFPVPESEVQSSLGADGGNASQFEWFSGLYDHHRWRRRLAEVQVEGCRRDMAAYLGGLFNATSWATKMYDSSGRYPTQFLFGNDYWLGSKTHCEELTDPRTNIEVPPFEVQFYVAKVRVNINEKLTPVTRQLNVGECLPKSCGVSGVKMLLAQESNMGASVNIVGVREVPGNYSLFTDVKVYYVGGSGLTVLAIVIIASITHLTVGTARKPKEEDVEYDNNNTSSNGNLNGSTQVLKAEGKKTRIKRNVTALKLLLCFSGIHNAKKIMSVEKISLESIKCIHGLRFISIAWIILVHTYLEIFAVAHNKNLRILTERGFMYQTISNATFSVDTFFFISGLLVTLTYFRTNARKPKPTKPETPLEALGRGVLQFTMMLSYRLLRLTPAYLFVLGINEVIMRYLHSNSVFSPAIIDHISCDKYWWRNVLYINNFYPQEQFCMLWSWYMANDTQFYVVAAVLLLIAIRGEKQIKFAAFSILILLVASWITTFLLATKWDYVARVEEPFALFDQLYDKPWMRIGPYLVGMVAGYLLFKMNCTLTIPPVCVVLGWSASLACLGCLVYGLGRGGLVLPASAFYAALGHTAWGLSLAWITIACSCGYGGLLNSMFTCKLFLPLSRLTYCAYLIHPVLMCLISFHLDGSLHLHTAMAVVIYFGNLVLSFLTAFAISMTFEAPIVNILKLVF